jgi:hypothetical protein
VNVLDKLNKNNLSLRDTEDLLLIAEILETSVSLGYKVAAYRAKSLLDDFIARRGYDENATDHATLRKGI